MIRASNWFHMFAVVACLLVSVNARADTAGEREGNKLEKKGSVEERAANADKAKGSRLEKAGEAEEKAGKKSGSKSEEAAGKRAKNRGKAIEKAGEAKGDEAMQMKKSGNDTEKSGVKAKKALHAAQAK